MPIPKKYKRQGQNKPCCPAADENCFIESSRVDKCFCDLSCVQFGDCCVDYTETCAWIQPGLDFRDLGELNGENGGQNQENITFLDDNEFFLWVLSTEQISSQKISQVLSHGCNCPLLNFENKHDRTSFGGTPVDDFDGFCKDLLRHRRCLKMNPTNCGEDSNIEPNQFEVVYNFETNQYSCGNNVHKTCARLRCEANLMSALKIVDYLRLNEGWLVSPTVSECALPGNMGIKHDTCCLENLVGFSSENGTCNTTGTYFYEDGSAFKKKYFEIY